VSQGRTAVALCLFLSGAGSLILEVVWGRLLRLVFGSTTLAVSTVLVAYMLGLGLGGLVGGRIAARLRNGVRVYGWMEIAIAAYAAGVPFLLDRLPGLTRDLLAPLDFWPAAMLRFALVLALLLLPTVCMGATLPVLVAALVRGSAPLARSVGLLYGVNTLGAVTGVLAATFALFPLLGVRATNMVGAAVDLVVGVLAIALVAPRVAAAPSQATAKPLAPRLAGAARTRWNPALLAYGTVGFTALVYEVCWTRALSMILGSSVYAFATMLAAFLSGIALGSLAGRRWFDGLRRPMLAYAVGLALLGLLSLATVVAFRFLPDAFIALVAQLGASKSSLVLIGVLVSMAAMLAPTLVLGGLFPLLTRALDAGDHGRTVGDVYFVNTLGSAAGAFSAGFLLIPALGLRHSLALAMAINFAASAAVLLWQREWRGRARAVAGAALAAVAALLIVAPPGWDAAGLTRGVYRFPGEELDVGIELLPLAGVAPEEILYYREGINTTVSVHRREGQVHLRVNGKADASSGGDMATQVLLGQIPMLFGARAERVLVIGYASGTTVGSAALHQPARIDAVELEPAMVEASRFFDDVNGRPLERPFVRLVVDDGRAFLANTPERYDVIISEPSNPWITGASSLFTREFFAAARRALAPGGRFCQWVQLYGIDAEGLRSIVAALRAEVPYVYGFLNSAEETDLILVATESPLGPADLPRWQALSPAVQADLQRIGHFSTADLWSLLRFGPAQVDAMVAQARALNTDDSMRVELESPWHLYDVDAVPENLAVVRPEGAAVLELAEAGGAPLSGEQVGALAMAYAAGRDDPAMARALAGLARERGAVGYARAAEARAGMTGDQIEGETLAQLHQAVQESPGALEAHLLLAEALNDSGQSDEALAEIETALRLAPGDLRARRVRLEILLSLERSAEARAEGEALLATPLARQVEVALYSAAAAADLGRLDQAIAEMRAVVARSPHVPVHWAVLAQIYAGAGRTAEAQQAADNAERATTNLVLRMHQKALRDEKLISRERAIQSLELALQLDPGYAPARRDLERLRK